MGPLGVACSHQWNFPASLSVPPRVLPGGHVMDWASTGIGAAMARARSVIAMAGCRTAGSARQAAQRGPRQPREDPLPAQLRAQALVEADRGPVPVEHRPL